MVGPLYMHMWLLMATSGPIIFLGSVLSATGWAHYTVYAYGAADGYIWADYYSGRHCQCNKVGPSNMCMWLLMALSGPIFALESAPDVTGWA